MPLIPPTKINLGGNKGASQQFIKFATAQLAILERQMSFQKLNEGRRVVSPFNGVMVECTSKFGRKEVNVYVAPFVPPVPAISDVERVPLVSEEIIKTPVCDLFEFPCFAVGMIEDILQTANEDDDKNYYSIAICNGKSYVTFDTALHISTCSWEEYEIGQLVMVTAHHGADVITPDCCNELPMDLTDCPWGILITPFLSGEINGEPYLE
jgi:hypothetical protein